MSNKQADKRIAALERGVAALKAAPAPPPTPPFIPEDTAAYREHQAAEARANNFVTLSPERRREMERACSTEDLRDLVHASASSSRPIGRWHSVIAATDWGAG
jgi:hypothetical protein